MRTIDWAVNSEGGDTLRGSLEAEDDATDEQIEEAVSQEVFNVINWGWSERGK